MFCKSFLIFACSVSDIQVAGLARRVHDSPTLQDKFDRLVIASDLTGQKSALTRRVPTRWNSDFACLSSHVYFESPVKALTGDERNGLKDYELSKEQWALAKEVEGVLEVGSSAVLSHHQQNQK